MANSGARRRTVPLGVRDSVHSRNGFDRLCVLLNSQNEGVSGIGHEPDIIIDDGGRMDLSLHRNYHGLPDGSENANTICVDR